MDTLIMDGYIRVSVVGGRAGDRFQSPTAQRETIQRYADAMGITIAAWYEDLDKSGGTLDRPGLQAILSRIDTKETGGIIVAKLDRLSRSVQDGLNLIQRIDDAGGKVVAIDNRIDTSSANGRMLLAILLVIAQWYRESADEQLAAAQARAISRGALPGKTPYGCTRLENGTILPDPETAAIVKRMVTERAQGRGWRAIARGLTLDEIPTPRGNGVWAAPTVESIVTSEACLGIWTGPRGARVEDAWPPMVDRLVWDAAQMVRGKRPEARNYQDRLLAGIARCSGCRHTMKRTTNQQGQVSYGCTNRSCPARASIGASMLDSYVYEILQTRIDELTVVAQASMDEDDGAYGELLSARDNALYEFERWRDDTDMIPVIGESDYRSGLIKRAQDRDATAEALSIYMSAKRASLAMPEGLPADRALVLTELDWRTQCLVAEAYLHAVFVRRSLRRGPYYAKDVAGRTRIVFRDERDLPQLPSPVTGELPPVEWAA
jgi:site-specific DNA recombinase